VSTYSKLLGTLNTTTAMQTFYTVPAAVVAVVRDLEATDFSGMDNQLFFQISVPGFKQAVIVLQTLAGPKWSQWTGRLVVPSGGLLQAASAHTGHSIAVSGYELDD
jgi:hypothetical protein